MPTPQNIFKRQGHMPYFLLVSLGLHIGIVLPWTPVFDFTGSRETVLTVNFDAPAHPASIARNTATRPATTEAPQTTVMTVTPSVAPLPTAESQTEAVTENALARGIDTQEAPSESTRSQIQTRLLEDVHRHFEYPLLARRRGWQGTVLLTFTLESDGVLERIHVVRSSGYDVLDNSAIAALKRVGRLAEAEHWLNGRAFEMRIPVIYKLKDN